jgi:hypothetical protein
VMFPRQDMNRVPQHWRTFGTRKSVLTGSPRLATNPPNAILNYCYALLESESRLALAALGLDPGMGMLHVDTPARDSLACDIMEAVRPSVDAWLLDWITREPLRRCDFVEEKNGNCRLIPAFAAKLSETAHTWGKLVAPWAEYIARKLWATKPRSHAREIMPTRLTQQHRRAAKGRPSRKGIASVFPVRDGWGCRVKQPRPSTKCSECPKQCFCGSSEHLQQNHLGGWRHVPWLFLPFCESPHHAEFHAMCRRAGVYFSETGNRSLALIQALKAMLVAMWMVLDTFEKHIRKKNGEQIGWKSK